MKQASIQVKGFILGDSKFKLTIFNSGIATAKNIRFECKELEDKKSGIIILHNGNELCPMLHKNKTMDIPVVLTINYTIPIIILNEPVVHFK